MHMKKKHWIGQHRFDSLTGPPSPGQVLVTHMPPAFPYSIRQQAWKQNKRGEYGGEIEEEKERKKVKETKKEAGARRVLSPGQY